MVFVLYTVRKVYGIPVDSTNLLAMRFDFSMICQFSNGSPGGGGGLVAKPFYLPPRQVKLRIDKTSVFLCQ